MSSTWCVSGTQGEALLHVLYANYSEKTVISFSYFYVKNDNFNTQFFSPLIEWVLAGVDNLRDTLTPIREN